MPIRKTPNTGAWKCQCHNGFASLFSLERHIKLSKEKTLQCPAAECFVTFAEGLSEQSYWKHMGRDVRHRRARHQNPIVSIVWSYDFANDSWPASQQRVTHGLANLDDTQMQAIVEGKASAGLRKKRLPGPSATLQPDSNRPFTCYCGKRYTEVGTRNRHVANSQRLSFQCPVPFCLYLYENRAGIVSHMLRLRQAGDRGHLDSENGPIVCHKVTG